MTISDMHDSLATYSRTKTIWTAEQEARLSELYVGGKSSGKIAFELGMTRNAIIGKVHRLVRQGKLKARGNLVADPQGRAAMRQMRREAKEALGIKNKAPTRLRLSLDFGVAKAPDLELPIPAIEDAQIPAKQRVSLFGLTNETCRWPVNDPGTPEFFFCGGPADLAAGRPYCPLHRRRASGKAMSLAERYGLLRQSQRDKRTA